MIYRTDYHIHTLFSDGKADARDYIEYAIKTGLDEIGFSEHLNLFVPGQHWCMDPGRAGEYIGYLKKLRRSYRGKIEIRIGLEVDFFPGKEQEIFNFLAPLDLDYIIGSVHYMGETTVDSGPDFYKGKNIDELYSSYFDLLCQAVESGLFDILGHSDLVRIYNFSPMTCPEPLYRKLAHEMACHDVALELNTNGRNRPLADFYPDRRFLKIFREAGVPVCVNSDAHFPERTGQYFEEAYSLLAEAGYNEMCAFRGRERSIIPAEFK
ncbi:MAG TPA: histidinol-phosphatase [Bacteroidales bacterium]|nr:histidinol-phosphatase [Bacteroidales bacterium]